MDKAWGENRYTWGDTPTSFQYTGQRNDAIIGLLFYNARYYDPALGRFVSADTIIPNPASPQDFNRYSYTRNNPLKYVDPSGHRSCGPDANPLDETCDENMDDPGYGDDGPNAGDEPYTWPPQFPGNFHPGQSGCDALSGMSTQCGDLGVVEKTIIGGLVFGPIILPYLIEMAPAWYLEYMAAGKVATTGATIVAACGGDCSDEVNGGLGSISRFTEMIFRNASGTPDSLTPRPGIDDVPGGGLSFWRGLEYLNPGKYVVIDASKLTNLTAVLDISPEGHVTVAPSTLAQLQEWAATRGTGAIHTLTQELINAIVEITKK